MEMLRKIPLGLALALALSTAAHASSTLKLLKSFCSLSECSDGETPSGTLITDNSHNIYGTTQSGGTHGGGVVFELLFNPDTSNYRYRKLYNFCDSGGCVDGAAPVNAKLVIDTNGTLYGTTSAGGTSNNGVVFELVPNETKTHYHYVKIYEFCVEFSGCEDGARPTGGLTFAGQDQGQTYDGKAALYGSTLEGGRGTDSGLIFSLVPPVTGQEFGNQRQLYKFCRFHHTVCTDGASPGGNLVVDKNGNLWGTAAAGGNASDAGLIFELTPTTSGPWAESTPYLFCQQAACADGSTPTTGLAVDGNGNFYGTTSTGGLTYRKCADTGCGVIFKLTSSGATESTLYSFCKLAKCADGGMPEGVVLDPNNNIYGANNIGGPKHNGNFFRLNGTTMTDLYDIKCVNNVCNNGINPTGSLMLNANDDLFGGFMNAGRNGQGGELFELND
jgi:uncharacterized repeat protein (TIGR03803 family)